MSAEQYNGTAICSAEPDQSFRVADTSPAGSWCTFRSH